MRFSAGALRAEMLSCLCSALAGLLLLPLLLTLACPFLLQDLRFFLLIARAAQRARRAGSRVPPRTILEVFLERARRTPHKPMLLFGEQVLTYRQVDQLSDRAARALREQAGLRPGDVVALFMGNQPAYVWLWLGCAKLGCALACLNCNIRQRSLVHCFQCCGARVLLAEPGEPPSPPPALSLPSTPLEGSSGVLWLCHHNPVVLMLT